MLIIKTRGIKIVYSTTPNFPAAQPKITQPEALSKLIGNSAAAGLINDVVKCPIVLSLFRTMS